MRIAFLTIEERGDFVIDDELAAAELGRRGVQVDEVPWRRAVDWRVYDGVVIRTTWDYQRDLDGVFAVLDEIERLSVPLANSSAVVRWNAHKSYLRDLAGRGIPIAPTRWGRGLSAAELPMLPRTFAGVDEVVLKPAIGANADDTYRVRTDMGEPDAAAIAARFADREWMAQPFLPAILEEGELSTFHFHGRLSHAVRKRPAPGDFRVQEEHGGLIEPWTRDSDARRAADAILAALGDAPLQARLDLFRLVDGTLALMELEVIEPSLYFRMHEDAPANFADAIESWLARGRSTSS